MRSIPLVLIVLATSLLALPAQEKPASRVAIAALSLPPESDGLLHLRVEEGASKPLQLSLRYFTAPLKVPGGVLHFFKDPVPAKPPSSPSSPSSPLLTVRIPETVKLAYVVLSSAPDAQGNAVWQSRVFDAAEWPGDSLKLLNACSAPLGVVTAGKKLKLQAGHSVNYTAADYPESFPVAIYQLESVGNHIFSSTWRVSAGQRELCILFNQNGAISLRSFMAAGSPPTP